MKTKSSIATLATATLLLAANDVSAVKTGLKTKEWTTEQAMADSELQSMIKEQVQTLMAENMMTEAAQKTSESSHSKTHSAVSLHSNC